jgi:hypothetical protein
MSNEPNPGEVSQEEDPKDLELAKLQRELKEKEARLAELQESIKAQNQQAAQTPVQAVEPNMSKGDLKRILARAIDDRDVEGAAAELEDVLEKRDQRTFNNITQVMGNGMRSVIDYELTSRDVMKSDADIGKMKNYIESRTGELMRSGQSPKQAFETAVNDARQIIKDLKGDKSSLLPEGSSGYTGEQAGGATFTSKPKPQLTQSDEEYMDSRLKNQAKKIL